MFSPVGPVAPDAPCRPGKPGVPGGPIGPVKPVEPRNPCGPVNPRGPGGPPRPGGPVCPTTPVEPVYIYIIETSSHARARVAWLVMHCTAEPRNRGIGLLGQSTVYTEQGNVSWLQKKKKNLFVM